MEPSHEPTSPIAFLLHQHKFGDSVMAAVLDWSNIIVVVHRPDREWLEMELNQWLKKQENHPP